MPTDDPSGRETIGERLTRLRADLARVRLTIAREEQNAQSYNLGGTAATEIAYDRAITRARELEQQIASLEDRLDGNASRPFIAQLQTKFD